MAGHARIQGETEMSVIEKDDTSHNLSFESADNLFSGASQGGTATLPPSPI